MSVFCSVCHEPLNAYQPYYITTHGPTCLGCVLEHDIELGLQRARKEEQERRAQERYFLHAMTPLLRPVEEVYNHLQAS